jgi:hypothetical protein
MDKDRPYTLNVEKERLIFMTLSYRAEKESVLHKGIYSRELASMLSSATITGILYIYIAFNYSMHTLYYLILLIVFVLTFIGLRESIFKERALTLILDRTRRMATIMWPRVLWNKTETIPFDQIESVEVGSKRIVPENIDGIEFVERISRQHGSAVPGLAEEAEFVTLNLRLKDGSERLIYAQKIGGRIDEEPDIPLREIRAFLQEGNNLAKED